MEEIKLWEVVHPYYRELGKNVALIGCKEDMR